MNHLSVLKPKICQAFYHAAPIIETLKYSAARLFEEWHWSSLHRFPSFSARFFLRGDGLLNGINAAQVVTNLLRADRDLSDAADAA